MVGKQVLPESSPQRCRIKREDRLVSEQGEATTTYVNGANDVEGRIAEDSQ